MNSILRIALLALPLICIAPQTGTAGEKESIQETFATRLAYHKDMQRDLRIPPIAAADRRKAIPNNNTPPQKQAPSVMLPPRPESKAGVIRRVEITNGEKVCALTFDLCELATVTTGFDADIVTWLQDNSIPATLFMGGKWMRTHAKRVRELMRDPLFEIGNHAWSHGNFGIMSEEKMKEQILFTQAQYEELYASSKREAERLGGGVDTQSVPTLFRFPYGRTSEKALSLLADYGLTPIQWDVVAEGDNNASLTRGREVAGKIQSGSIVLFHANLVPVGSFQLLRYVVRDLQQKGFRFVCVSELLSMGKPVITPDGYFNRPGDNRSLDTRYGEDGTGKK